MNFEEGKEQIKEFFERIADMQGGQSHIEMSDIKVYEGTVQDGNFNNLPEDILEKCVGMFCVEMMQNMMYLYTQKEYDEVVNYLNKEDSEVAFYFLQMTSVVTDREALASIIFNSYKCENSRAIIKLRVLEYCDNIEIRILSVEE